MTWATARRARLRNLFVRQDHTGREDLPMLSVYRDYGVVLREGRDDNYNKPGEDLGAYRVVRRGDLVLNKMKTWQGSLGISEYDGIVSPAYFVARPLTRDSSAFLHHLLRSRPLIAEYGARSKGIRPAQWDLPWEEFQDITVELPPLDTQRAVADYLDRETAWIDALIAAKQRMIELLEDRVRLLARELTTNDGVAMPLRRLLRTVKTGTTPPVEEFSRLSGGTVPWYSPGDVDDWLHLSRASRTLTAEAVAEDWVPRFPSGSTLVVGIGATAGKIAFLDHVASGNQQMTCLVPAPRIAPRFLSWQLFARQEELRATAPFTTLPILNNEFIKSVSMVVPPMARQVQVVERLDDEAASCRALARCVDDQIALLLERRQALITAAVTGQIDIFEAA